MNSPVSHILLFFLVHIEEFQVSNRWGLGHPGLYKNQRKEEEKRPEMPRFRSKTLSCLAKKTVLLPAQKEEIRNSGRAVTKTSRNVR